MPTGMKKYTFSRIVFQCEFESDHKLDPAEVSLLNTKSFPEYYDESTFATEGEFNFKCFTSADYFYISHYFNEQEVDEWGRQVLTAYALGIQWDDFNALRGNLFLLSKSLIRRWSKPVNHNDSGIKGKEWTPDFRSFTLWREVFDRYPGMMSAIAATIELLYENCPVIVNANTTLLKYFSEMFYLLCPVTILKSHGLVTFVGNRPPEDRRLLYLTKLPVAKPQKSLFQKLLGKNVTRQRFIDLNDNIGVSGPKTGVGKRILFFLKRIEEYLSSTMITDLHSLYLDYGDQIFTRKETRLIDLLDPITETVSPEKESLILDIDNDLRRIR